MWNKWNLFYGEALGKALKFKWLRSQKKTMHKQYAVRIFFSTLRKQSENFFEKYCTTIGWICLMCYIWKFSAILKKLKEKISTKLSLQRLFKE